jgi:hypothetical protein
MQSPGLPLVVPDHTSSLPEQPVPSQLFMVMAEAIGAAARQRPTRKAAVKVILLELSGRLYMQTDWMAVFGGVSGDLSRAIMDQVREEDLYRQRWSCILVVFGFGNRVPVSRGDQAVSCAVGLDDVTEG